MSRYLEGCADRVGAVAPPKSLVSDDAKKALTAGMVRLQKLAEANETRIKEFAVKDSIILAMPVGANPAGSKIVPKDVREGFENALQINKSLAGVILEIVQKGTITNPDTRESRAATPEDVARLFTVMARQAEVFQLNSELAGMLSISGGMADVLRRTVKDFAQMAADFFLAAKEVVKGATRTISLIGQWFPLVAVGAGGFALWIYLKGRK